MYLLYSFIVLLLCGIVLGVENKFTVHSARELIEFSNSVNDLGMNYSGTTVYIDSDIEFTDELSKEFRPIGEEEIFFRGVFNGHGHVIRNLQINISSTYYVGLFGITDRASIQNVIIDSSCSVTSTYSSSYDYPHVGGIIGCCSTDEGPCNIYNTINMANVVFRGKSVNQVWIGGIVGHTQAKNNKVTIKNCANYGDIISSGTSSSHTYIGGIIGFSNYDYQKTTQNCLNYGSLIFNGTVSSNLVMGGILGGTSYGNNKLENCMSTGKIKTTKTSNYIASVVGKGSNNKNVDFVHCFWTSNTGYNKLIGSGGNTNTDSSITTLDANSASLLKEYTSSNPSWSKWLFNGEIKTATFKINNKFFLNLTYQLILLPELADDESNKFYGWYTDSYCTTLLVAAEMTENMTLYGLYKAVVTITLDFNGGLSQEGTNISTKKVEYKDIYGNFPEITRAGYKFDGWFTEKTEGNEILNETVMSVEKGHTLYAHWTPNKYTVKYEVNGGDALSEIIKEVTFDEKYGELPEPVKNGYTFVGWYTEETGGDEVLNETVVSIFNNHVLYAHWSINNYTIFFDTKGGVPVDSIKAQYLSTVEIQSTSSKEYCTFLFWKTKDNVEISGLFTVPAKNTTLYAVWLCTRISSAEELIEFSNSVNDLGMNYSGTTVYIDSDIEFTDELSKEFRPIGEELSSYFLGIFDGQGHTISGLTANFSSFQYTGIFGYSMGTTIRNIVVDDSCSFKSSYYNTSSSYFLAGIIGYCYANRSQCIIENSVNMASIEFNGRIGFNLFFGGIVGELYRVEYFSLVRNCANYGSLTHSGTVDGYMFIGGIIGECYRGYVQNCANYGSFAQEEKRSNTIGGIVGKTWVVSIENCLSVGKITSSGTSGPIGSIVGNGLNSSTVITNCFWTSDTKYNKAYGSGSPKVTGSTQKTINIDLVNTLNTRSASNSWNNWLLNMNGVSVSFKINDYRGFSVKPKVILLPNPADNDERLFDGWYKDPALISLFADSQVDSATTLYGTFCTLKFTVTLNVTSGEELKTNVATIRCNGTYGDLPEPEKEGYTFSGWYTELEGGGNKIEPGDRVTNLNNHTLYAHWTVNNYTITFNFGNGTEIERNVTYGDKYGELPEPEKKGYTFIGWYTEKDGNGDEIEETTKVGITEDTNIYAHWTANNYTVSYDVNGGNDLHDNTKNVTFDNTYGDLSVPTRTGFTFAGWYTDKTYSEEITATTKVTTADHHTVYAKWDINGYLLTFVFDNGTDPEERSLDYNDHFEFPADPEKEGHTFVGWNNSVKVMPASNLTIKALWAINNYTLTLIFNNGTEPEVRTLNYSQKIEYPVNPKRTGYTFDGWDNKPNTMPANDTTITALWTINNYTLTFVFDNGIEPEVRILNYSQEIEYPAGSEREGYTFDKWDNKPATMPANDTTIIALWTANNYTLTLCFGNGTVVIKNVTYRNKYGELPEPEKKGYTFIGWFTEKDGNGDEIEETTKVGITEDTNIYAHWTANNYTVSYDVNGGNDLPDNTKNVTFDSAYCDLSVPTRTGFTFAGWYTDKTYSEEITATTKVTTAGHHTVYAKWDINGYLLTFVFDNGTDPEERSLDYNDHFEFPADPEKEGYTFVGWNNSVKVMPASNLTIKALWAINNYTLTLIFNNGTEPEVRTLNYSQKIEYPVNPKRTGYTFDGWDNKPNTMPANDTTITALWTANNYTVTFNPTGGDVTPLSKEVTYDSAYRDLPTPTRVGYGFNGWFTEEDGKGDKVTESTTVKITNNQTLYANWTAGAITVTFNATGGISPQTSKPVVYDSEYGELPEAEKEGYTFSGWFTEEEGGSSIENTTRVTNSEHHTLYAHWDINNYTLTFIFGNRTEPEVRILNYSQKIEYPPDPEREGYTFDEWDKEIDKMPANDTTITALWIANNYALTLRFGNRSEITKNVTYGDKYGELPEPEKTGYMFNGWFTEENGKGDEITSETKVRITENVFLYAHWTANNYTVSYDVNGGNDLPDNTKNVTFDSPYGDLSVPTRTGFTFAGWYTDKTYSEEITATTKVTTADHHTIYAKWDINGYLLTFVFDNGVDLEERSLDFNDHFEFPADPEKEGYTFAGWNNSVKIMPASNLTIKALWRINNYTLIFIFDNGTEPVVRILNYSQNIDYPVEPERKGYNFDEWDNKLGAMPANDTTITALWTINNYTLTFVFNNGTDPEVRILNFSQKIEYLANPEKEGYTFDKWDNKPDTMPANDTTITALWTANNYTLTLCFEDGSEVTKNVTYRNKYGELPEPEKKGYTFIGWYTEKDGNGDEIEETTKVGITEDTNIYAHWTANNYTVSYDVNGGNNLPDNIKNVTFDSPYGDLSVPTRTGFTFAGWYTDKTYSEEITATIKVTTAGHHTIYAKWDINGYLLTFVFDNGANPEERSLDFNDHFEFPADPEREGYTFAGWNNSVKVMPASNLTINALWVINNYTLAFIFNNSIEPEIKTLNYSQKIDYPVDPEKEGYSFDGWDNKPDAMPANDTTITALWKINEYKLKFDFGNGEIIEETHEFNEAIEYPKEFGKEGYSFDKWDINITNMPARNLTVTAQWTINSYKLIFNFVNGTEPDVRYVAFNDPVNYPEDPEKEGYTFAGWDNYVQYMPSDDFVATAQWTINEYPLTFDLDNGNEPEVRYVPFNELIVRPEGVMKEGHTFIEWNDTTEFMPAHDLVIKAQWGINSYEIVFDFKNGTTIKNIVKYGEAINYPENVENEGYKFDGWKPKPRTMPAYNFTAKAQWVETMKFVEIVLGTTDLTEKEIIELLKKYTDSEFTVDRLEYDYQEGTTQIIIKFNDPDEVDKVVGKVMDDIKEGGNTYFRDVSAVRNVSISYSYGLYPLLFSFIPLLLC